MNAFDKLMAAAIAKGRPQTRRQNRKSLISKTGARRAKPSKSFKKTTRKPDQQKPRVVSAPAGHTRLQPYNPPRAPDVERRELTESFAPAPTPPEVPGAIAPLWLDRLRALPPLEHGALAGPATDWVDGRVTERPSRPASVEAATPAPIPAPFVASSTTARGSCKAVDAATGRQCKLPAHPEAPDQHRHERGPFHRLLPAGAVPPLREALDFAALASPGAGEGVLGRKSDAQSQRESRARKSAHAGDVTTEAHRPEDSKYFTPQVMHE